MSKDETCGPIDRLRRQHRRMLPGTNIVLLLVVFYVLLTTTEAPVVLYQAF